jgi:hypothetical protein
MVVVPVVVGVPEIRASALAPATGAGADQDNPAGSAPDSVIEVTAGPPVAVTAISPAFPTGKSWVAALVKVGGPEGSTAMVTGKVAVDPDELVAVMVIG